MVDYILLKNGVISLPYRVGDIYVAKNKKSINNLDHKQLDWKTTNEVGKRVYLLNEHTDGYKYFFQWDKGKLRQLYLYRCQLTRKNKRRLAKLIKEGGLDYFEKR